MRVEFSYGKLGRRLRQIGDLDISYDMLGSQPKTLGHLDLDRDMERDKLRGIAELDETMVGGGPGSGGGFCDTMPVMIAEPWG